MRGREVTDHGEQRGKKGRNGGKNGDRIVGKDKTNGKVGVHGVINDPFFACTPKIWVDLL